MCPWMCLFVTERQNHFAAGRKNILKVFKRAHSGAPNNTTQHVTLCAPPPPLQVALSVQGGGEGHVVQGSGDSVGSRVGRHAGDAVLRLVGGQLPPQLVCCDVVLMETKMADS